MSLTKVGFDDVTRQPNPFKFNLVENLPLSNIYIYLIFSLGLHLAVSNK